MAQGPSVTAVISARDEASPVIAALVAQSKAATAQIGRFHDEAGRQSIATMLRPMQ